MQHIEEGDSAGDALLLSPPVTWLMPIASRLAVLLVLMAPVARAQTTAYYDALKTEFARTNGLAGGTFVVGGDEATVWNAGGVYGASSAFVTPTGTPFTRARRLVRTTAGNPYDAAAQIRSAAPIAAGDALVLVFWLRRASAPEGSFVRVPIERGADPYEKLLLADVLPRDVWQRTVVSVVADRAMAAGVAPSGGVSEGCLGVPRGMVAAQETVEHRERASLGEEPRHHVGPQGDRGAGDGHTQNPDGECGLSERRDDGEAVLTRAYVDAPVAVVIEQDRPLDVTIRLVRALVPLCVNTFEKRRQSVHLHLNLGLGDRTEKVDAVIRA